MYSLEKSIVSFESGQEDTIKFWDVSTLQMYKKIDLKQKINIVKASHQGLFSISSEKGHLNFYKF